MQAPIETGTYDYDVMEYENQTYIIIGEGWVQEDGQIRGSEINVFDSGWLTIDNGYQASTTQSAQVNDATKRIFQRYP